jgi:hypothetical protein
MRIHAGPDPGQNLETQKAEFLHNKYTHVKWQWVKKHTGTYVGKKAYFKDRKLGLFVNFDQFPCSWFRIRIPNRILIRDSKIKAYPSGFGSTASQHQFSSQKQLLFSTKFL